jgi:hypothetical protein
MTNVRHNHLFAISFVIVFLINAISFPSLMLKSEMWAEMGTNYFFHAHFSNLLANIKATDAGYLPWLPRIFALIGEYAKVPIGYLPYYYGFVASVLVAGFSSAVSLPFFREYVASDLIRIICAVLLGTYLNYELHTFINMSYFGAIILVLIFWSYLRLEELSVRMALGLAILIFGLAVSKALFISFLLPAVAICTWAMVRKKPRLLMIFFPFLVGLILQLAVTALNRHTMVQDVSMVPVFIKILSAIVYTLGAVYINTIGFLFGFTSVASIGHRMWIIIAVPITGYLLYFAFLRMNWRSLIWPSFLVFSVAGTNFLINCVTFSHWYRIDKLNQSLYSLMQGRFWFIGNVAIFLWVVHIISKGLDVVKLRKNAVVANALFLLWIFGGPAVFRVNSIKNNDFSWPQVGYSNWGKFIAAKADLKDSICIPVNPYPWMLLKNCEVLQGPAATEFSSAQFQKIAEAYLAPSKSEHWGVQNIGVAMHIQKSDEQDEAISLVAYDKSGLRLAQSSWIGNQNGDLKFFVFDRPVVGISKIRLEGAIELAQIQLDASGQPLWVWTGQQN